MRISMNKAIETKTKVFTSGFIKNAHLFGKTLKNQPPPWLFVAEEGLVSRNVTLQSILPPHG